jgi:hypothetical protein
VPSLCCVFPVPSDFSLPCEAYATWISLGRPIRRPVPLEELRSKISLEKSEESSPSATISKLTGGSTPLLSQRTSSSTQTGGNSQSSIIYSRVLDNTRTGVQRIPSNARIGVEFREPKPASSSRVQDHQRAGTQSTPSTMHESGSNPPTFHRIQATVSVDVSPARNTSIRGGKKIYAAEQPRALKPAISESLVDWEWNADEGCFQPRQMHDNR